MAEPPTLQPLNGLSAFFHGRFEADHDGHTWTVDADFLDFGQRVHLYRDRVEADVQKSPARFSLSDGAEIRAEMSLLGMREIDLVADDTARTLVPVDGTPEAWRLRLEREHPQLSRAIGALSWIVLVIALVAGIGQLASLASLDSPLAIGGAFGTLLGVAALIAAFERALRYKSNRWLD